MIKRDLTPTDALAGYLVRWETAHLSCEPAQRPTAEHGIRAAYAAAGFPTPRIVWCRSPIEIAQEIAAAKLPHAIGRNVKTDVFDEVKRRVEVLVEVFCKETLTAAAELPNANSSNAAVADYNRFLSVCSGMSEIVDAAATECLSQFSVRTRHALMRLRGAPRLLPRYKFAEAAAGPLDLATLGVFEYLYEVAQWEELIAPLRGWWAIAKSAGWVVPHEHVCWISERPDWLRHDAKGHLHCVDGPALRYPDGWSTYCWKGVRVDPSYLEDPEQITLSTIDAIIDPVERNCLIDIMTPERFIQCGGASRVCADETGVLWRRNWTHRGSTIGRWAAVEVMNATPEPDGSHRHYFLRVPSRVRTPREAVAWTYGLTPERYAGLELRT